MIADPLTPPTPYRSFWMAGFEGADHVNGSDTPLDLVQSIAHFEHVDADCLRSKRIGVTALLESVGWRPCEPAGRTRDTTTARFDFSRVCHLAERRSGTASK